MENLGDLLKRWSPVASVETGRDSSEDSRDVRSDIWLTTGMRGMIPRLLVNRPGDFYSEWGRLAGLRPISNRPRNAG